MQSTAVTEAYVAERAAALAGVPKSTLHYWASHRIWMPSVSPEKIRLWSLSDIVALRLLYWLRRRDKLGPDEFPIPRTKMPRVREIASQLISGEISPTRTRVYVDSTGMIVLGESDRLENAETRQQHLAEGIALLREYRVDERRGVVGPDLVQPRPLLRIVPGKLAGEPHVKDTRVPTKMLDAMIERGYTAAEVVDLYPFLTAAAVQQARSLEQQLRRNLSSEAA